MSETLNCSFEFGKQVTIDCNIDFDVTPSYPSMDPWNYPDDPEEIEIDGVDILSACNTITGEPYPRHLMTEFHTLLTKTLLEDKEILYDLYYEELR